MTGFAKFAPSACLLFLGLGFEVSGIENPELAKIFWGLAFAFLLIPAWPYLRRLGFQPKEKSGIEFFATMEELRAKHPLSETFKLGNEIHAYLLTGEGIFAENEEYIRCVKRLILPRPDSDGVETLRKLSNSYVDFRSQIQKTVDLARQKNGTNNVKLFPSFIGVSLLFCNPYSPNGWVQVGIIIPGVESAKRQHWRIYKASQMEVFSSFLTAFDRLWNEGTTDSIEDLEFHSGYDK